MANVDAALTNFSPEQFVRKDLRRFFWPGQTYFIQLDAYAESLEEYVMTLEEQLAKDGNMYYQKDAAEWGKKWNRLQRQFGELQAEKIRMEAEKDAIIKDLEREIEYLRNQVIKDLERKIESLQNQIEDLGGRGKHQARDQKGRFISDVPKKEKMRRADELKRKGYSVTQIARSLGVSPETAKNYLRLVEEEQDARWEETMRNWKAAE